MPAKTTPQPDDLHNPVWSNNSYPPFLLRLRPAAVPFGMYLCVLRSLLLAHIRLCLTIGSHVDNIGW
jgi:hypothetical protein